MCAWISIILNAALKHVSVKDIVLAECNKVYIFKVLLELSHSPSFTYVHVSRYKNTGASAIN